MRKPTLPLDMQTANEARIPTANALRLAIAQAVGEEELHPGSAQAVCKEGSRLVLRTQVFE